METGMYLTTSLKPGGAVGHWQLGGTHEERFDVPDRTMEGEMDAFFFLTKDRNFIPHEYPCRTDFIATYRGARPAPVTEFEPSRVWLPFGSPRVDLSGFWFRATRVETWARTMLKAERDQVARFRFATCGGAFITVNGERLAELTRYQRNFEESCTVDVPLRTGLNEIRVWFADLCERDARYYFSVELAEGDGISVALPTPIPGDRALAVEAMLEGMRFEKPSYARGEVAIVFDEPARQPLDVHVEVRGDFMSTEGNVSFERRLAPGDTRIAVAETHSLPADFRHFDITVSDGGFVASRVLGVEIVHGDEQPPAAESLSDRARIVLDHVAEKGERDMVAALARLASGRGGSETDRIIDSCLPIIGDCHDCADFLLVPLLWCRIAFSDQIAPETRDRMDDVILRFRYWMDEPGNDVMWYFSENHALLFHTACHLAGTLFPDKVFVRSGRSGREQAEIGRQRLLDWLTHFEACEMAEWNSAPYFPIDLKGLCALFALSGDAAIRTRSGTAIRRLLEIMALSSHHGLMTASQGRSYEHTLRPGLTLELSGISYLAFGKGGLGRRFHALPQLALCFAQHGLEIDASLARFSDHQGGEAYEWRYKQGENGIASLYHFKTKDYALGSIARYRWTEWGYQETVLHLRMGNRAESQIWINHPGEVIHSGYGRPSYWGGCGTVPRVHQYRSLAVVDFVTHPSQPDFTHAWLPQAEMDEVIHEGHRILVRSGDALCLLVGSGPFTSVDHGPTAECEIRLPGHQGRWIVRLSDVATEGSLSAFGARFAGVSAQSGQHDEIILNDPDFGIVTCESDGVIRAGEKTLDPQNWTLTGDLEIYPEGRRVALPSQQQGRQAQRKIA